MYNEISLEYLHKVAGEKKASHKCFLKGTIVRRKKLDHVIWYDIKGFGVKERPKPLNLVSLAPSHDKVYLQSNSIPVCLNLTTMISRHQYWALSSVLFHTGISLWKVTIKSILLILTLTETCTLTSNPKGLCHHILQEQTVFRLWAKLSGLPLLTVLNSANVLYFPCIRNNNRELYWLVSLKK